MSEEYKTLIFYKEWFDVIDELPVEQRAVYYDSIMQYAFLNRMPSDGNIAFATSFIRSRINTDREKWNKVREKRAEAGRKGGIKSGQARAVEKVKEDDTKEEEKQGNNDAVKVEAEEIYDGIVFSENVAKFLGNSSRSWKETVMMQLHIDEEMLNTIFEAFQRELIAQGVTQKDASDIQRHFTNYSRIYLRYRNDGKNKVLTSKTEQDERFRRQIAISIGGGETIH